MLEPLELAPVLRTFHLVPADKRSFIFHATRTFLLDIEAISVFCFRTIFSRNTSLTELGLNINDIGDAGAVSISDALTYIFCLARGIFCLPIFG
jgi:hypothetical protein